jgi:NADPH2:quinone reductase
MNTIRIALTGGLEVLESEYVRTREDLTATMGAIFERYIAKELKVLIKPAYALEDGAEANRDLESRRSTRKLLLSVGG